MPIQNRCGRHLKSVVRRTDETVLCPRALILRAQALTASETGSVMQTRHGLLSPALLAYQCAALPAQATYETRSGLGGNVLVRAAEAVLLPHPKPLPLQQGKSVGSKIGPNP